MRRSSLTGAWSGAYRYPGDVMPETVFEADITETEGAFHGATREPNMFRLAPGSVITATIEGERHADAVRFVKFMDGNGGMHHSIRYEGVSNPDLTRIEGTWVIAGDWSGSFFMERHDDSVEEAALIQDEAQTPIRVK